jgi:hypothetical protein
VLEANLKFHFAQGVELVIATDNGSVDGTLEILRRYERAGLAQVIEERSDDYHRLQADWITRMARLAATDFGADWVINNDADEFWWPVSGTLIDAFASIPERYHAVAAPRPEFLPPPAGGEGTFAEQMLVRQARSHTTPKLAHRGLPDVNVFIGSHRLTRGESGLDSLRGSRRAVRPVLRAEPVEPEDLDLLVPAPRWPIRILHFPLRSYAQYEARVRRIALEEGEDLLEGRRKEMHEHLRSGRLPELYANLAAGEAVEAGLREGTLVRDTGLRDYLAACPDPLESGSGARPPAIPVRMGEADREAELAALEEDMMRALVRGEHTLLSQRARARRRLRDCRRKLVAARERERTLDQRRNGADVGVWSMMRRAARRLVGSGRRAG